jgi:hypothetical protein
MFWVMGSRPIALLRRIHPYRRVKRPHGSAMMLGSAGIALALFLCLAVTGCAQRESGADDNRPGGFYGGVSGGVTRP